jgi:hypothetical protein
MLEVADGVELADLSDSSGPSRRLQRHSGVEQMESDVIDVLTARVRQHDHCTPCLDVEPQKG